MDEDRRQTDGLNKLTLRLKMNFFRNDGMVVYIICGLYDCKIWENEDRTRKQIDLS